MFFVCFRIPQPNRAGKAAKLERSELDDNYSLEYHSCFGPKNIVFRRNGPVLKQNAKIASSNNSQLNTRLTISLF